VASPGASTLGIGGPGSRLIPHRDRVALRCTASEQVSVDMSSGTELPTEQAVREALLSVDDPEIGMNVVDLGLVYRIDVVPGRVLVEMTMTTPACPLVDLLRENARRAVDAVVPHGVDVDIELVWDPPWTSDRMSETARQAFGWPG